jgi:hypothetical protein
VETKLQKFKRLFPWMDVKYASFPWSDPEELNLIPLPPDLAKVKDELTSEYILPYKLPWLAGYVLKELIDTIPLESVSRYEGIERARAQAYTAYLADKVNGRIKNENTEPMPEELKQRFRKITEERKAEKKAKRELINSADAIIEPALTKETPIKISPMKVSGPKTPSVPRPRSAKTTNY